MSTEQTRAELIVALSQLSECRPEWRLGQTLANLAMTAGRMDSGGVWDLEDEEALAAARMLIEQFANAESAPTAIAIIATASPNPPND
jgi:hypothetical protein